MRLGKKELIFLVLLLPCIFIVCFIEAIKLFVNAALISQSFEFARDNYEAARLHLMLITQSFETVLGPVFLGMWKDLSALADTFTPHLGIENNIEEKGWRCEGFWTVGAFGQTMTLAMLLGFLISTDVFYLLAIKVRSWGQGSTVKKIFYRQVAGKVSGICVYSLQVLVSGFSTSWIYLFSWRYATGEARACGGFDNTLYWLSRTVGYVVLLGIIAFLLEIFGASRDKGKGKDPFQNWIITLAGMPLHFIAILLITVGYWNRGNANNYDIIGLAEKYDDDPDDDDNQHSAVGSILGSTRPIFWQLFPGGAILTKIGEATNAHIYFIDDNTGVDLQHGDNDRLNLAKYLLNVVPMAFTILFALFPSAGLAITTTIILMPKILLSAFDQAKEIFDAFFPEALATTAVAIEMAEPHVENAIDQGINHGNKLVKHGKELIESAKPHVEEGVKRGKELVDSAKPHVQNAMEEE